MTDRGQGLWITFEGVEGAGKSTQLLRLADRLRRRGVEPLCTREPGGTDFGRRLRAVLLEPSENPMCALAELHLYAADRAQHLVEVILPALEHGRVVLCDRYVDATLAYQGHGRQLGTAVIERLHRTSPLDRRPQRTLLFDIDVDRALARARDRDARSGAAVREGRFEQESLAFHRRVREGYLALAAAEPQRFRVLDADCDLESLDDRVDEQLADLPAIAGEESVSPFDSILGNEAAARMLRGMLERERVPHALLFRGPEGVGKATLAQAFATVLLCSAGRGDDDCDSCRAQRNHGHPDFASIGLLPKKSNPNEPSKQIVVEQIRALSVTASLAPRLAPRRVFLIDPADAMNLSAQNALLKTLEEPPGNAVLMLIAARPHLLLDTVRSRSFSVAMGPLATRDLAASLERLGHPADEALLRAALAEGRPGRAMALEPAERREQREAALGALESLCGPRRRLGDLSGHAAEIAGKTETTLVDNLELIQVLLRDAARAALDPDDPALVHADLSSRLARVGRALSPPRAAELVRAVDRLRADLRFNVNRILVAETLLAAVAGGPLPS